MERKPLKVRIKAAIAARSRPELEPAATERLQDAIKDAMARLDTAAKIRRRAQRGTPEYERAAADEKRFNADVTELVRKRNRKGGPKDP